jgi:hypothetical protein
LAEHHPGRSAARAEHEAPEFKMIDKFPMTAEGYAALEAELKYCREEERPGMSRSMLR